MWETWSNLGTFAGHRRKSIKMLLMLSMTRTRRKSRWLPDWWRCFMFVTNSIFLARQRCTYFSAISNIGYVWILSFSREKEKEIEYHKPLFFYKTIKEFVIEKDVFIFLSFCKSNPRSWKLAYTLFQFLSVYLFFSPWRSRDPNTILLSNVVCSNCHVIAIGEYLISWWAKARSWGWRSWRSWARA